jgi:hypothetical protein
MAGSPDELLDQQQNPLIGMRKGVKKFVQKMFKSKAVGISLLSALHTEIAC